MPRITSAGWAVAGILAGGLVTLPLAALPSQHPAAAVPCRRSTLPSPYPAVAVSCHRSSLPSLLVILTIDQLRADYLDRWAGQWTGGFRRFLRQAVFFRHGLQDHAVTETAPGHATLLSGREPDHTGIVVNELGVPDSSAPLVSGDGPGASPRRFVGTTLVDWLLAADSATRFLSVSAKDRGAILPLGRARGPVFWYADGQFTTSTYYADTLPSWVVEYNRRGWGERLAGRRWDLLLPARRYAEPDTEPFEDGPDGFLFPHHLPGTPSDARRELPSFPWMDSLTLDFALTGARELELGGRSGTDLLAIGLSATDYIGHDYGPDSREIHDHLLRLDRWLGGFLDSLASLVRGRELLVVLTADHGVSRIPERLRREHHPGGRIALGPLVRSANSALAAIAGEPAPLAAGPGLIYGDLDRLRSVGVDLDSLRGVLGAEVARLEGVARVFTPARLADPATQGTGAARWRRSLPADFPWLISAVARRGYIWSGATRGATHGTSNPEDVLVPIAFLGHGLHAGRIDRPVRTVDIAPTLAEMLGVEPRDSLDGVVLREVVGGGSSTVRRSVLPDDSAPGAKHSAISTQH